MWGVALGAYLQVDQAVAGQLVEHVIEKRHAGVHRAAAAAIEPERYAHIGLAGGAMHVAPSV